MPWDSQKQVRYLMSNGSPLNGGQKAKMASEMHSLGPTGYLRAPKTEKAPGNPLPRYRRAK